MTPYIYGECVGVHYCTYACVHFDFLPQWSMGYLSVKNSDFMNTDGYTPQVIEWKWISSTWIKLPTI